MKIFLTGANGFVGSHLLDWLQHNEAEVTALLRPTSNLHRIESHLPHIDVHYGSLMDLDSLVEGIDGTECVIHCAGKTKVSRPSQYYRVNRDGTRNLVEAVNEHTRTVDRVVHISSAAAGGPGTSSSPARESAAPTPVSEYGKSKLEGEIAVREHCQAPWTILRPAAVYGPRDTDFFQVFQAVNRHMAPALGGGRQEISLIYAPDLARGVWAALNNSCARGRIYNLAAPYPLTTREMVSLVAEQMEKWTIPVPLPLPALWPLCLLHEFVAKIVDRPSILSRDKYRELSAPGWVCSVQRLRKELGFVASTPHREGIAQTIDWYRRNEWL